MAIDKYIERYLDIGKCLEAGKVLVVYGPRRCGKTTLLQKYMETSNKSYIFYKGDDLRTQNSFSQAIEKVLIENVGNNEILIIDEAQMIPNIGASLKLLVDAMPKLFVVITGSSAFELAGQIGEPLTGRKITKYILPISISEYISQSNTQKKEISENLEDLLIYGDYPNSLTSESKENKIIFLTELVDSYLLKDILAFKDIKGSRVLFQILTLLAFQIGNEVSINEISTKVGIDNKTLERYLDLLEKSYIIHRLGAYSKNLRNEITKKSKYYFYDNGVRNALINNFNKLELRDDIGQLWENFIMTERLKKTLYYGPRANRYFWRTYQGNEIDLIEERDGILYGYEMKWKYNDKTRAPKLWLETYKNKAKWEQISPNEIIEFTKKW